ncbi:hypothetical protein BC059799_B0083 (plasmid) [Bacillus cereus NVH0597-99]|nr:hypothetical protein BC059799_B0083 [Bacillus cereus NVH0597-99]
MRITRGTNKNRVLEKEEGISCENREPLFLSITNVALC